MRGDTRRMRRVPLLLLPLLVAAGPGQERTSLDREIALGIPPQPARASDLHRRARPVRAETFTGMLVCSVEIVGNGWDGGDPSGPVRRLSGRPEVNLEVTIGEGTRPMRYIGREDTPLVHFAMPGLTLAQGKKIRLVVEDRDVVRNDPAGTVEFTYGGELPLRGNAEGVRVDCRAAPERDVEAGIEGAARRMETLLTPLTSLPEVDEDALDFGFDLARDDTARLAVYDLARFAGLGDARVIAALAKLDERAGVIQQRAAAAALAVRGRARPTDVPFRLPGTTIDARVAPQLCATDAAYRFNDSADRAQYVCAIPVAIEEAESARPPALTFHTVDANGVFTAVDPFVVLESGAFSRPRGGRYPAGSQSLMLGVPMQGAQLLRIGLSTGVVFVNVARPR